MAIARDATATASGIPSATSVTWSHTCTGSNLVLIVFGYADNTVALTGATYNGVAMTLITTEGPTATKTEYAWYLINPSTGAHNVVITAASTVSLTGMSASYTGASQTSQPSSFGSHSQAQSSANTATDTANLTTNSTDWVVAMNVSDNSWTTATASGDLANSVLLGGGWNGTALWDSNGTVSAGATTASITVNKTENIFDTFIVAVAIKAVAVANRNSNFFAFF